MQIPKVTSMLFRIFNVPSEAQQLINENLIERRDLPLDKRKYFVFKAGEFSRNWRVLAVWGSMVTFTDNPEKLLFVFIVPIWGTLILVEKLFG